MFYFVLHGLSKFWITFLRICNSSTQGSFFIQYLPAIKCGKRQVHWSNYKFDSDGFGFVSKALISPEWELTTTLSGCSLSKVTGCESRRLEQTLSDSPNNRASVLFSGSRQEIQTLFEHFDYKEFLQLCCVLRQIFTDISNSEG